MTVVDDAITEMLRLVCVFRSLFQHACAVLSCGNKQIPLRKTGISRFPHFFSTVKYKRVDEQQDQQDQQEKGQQRDRWSGRKVHFRPMFSW